MAAALFGQSSDGRREPKSLVEFRAGKMKRTGSTVTADTRKGLAFMKMEDGLLHFLWKDRKSGEVVDVSGGGGRREEEEGRREKGEGEKGGKRRTGERLEVGEGRREGGASRNRRGTCR